MDKRRLRAATVAGLMLACGFTGLARADDDDRRRPDRAQLHSARDASGRFKGPTLRALAPRARTRLATATSAAAPAPGR